MPGRARLTRDQRGVIEEGLAADGDVSWEELGLRVGVAASTVGREVKRNRGRLKYCAEAAQVRAGREARRPKVARLVEAGPLRDRVNTELEQCRSPAAIAADLAAEGGRRVCTESIYRALYAGELEVKAREVLRRRRAKRRNRQQRHESKRPGVPNIALRPAAVNDRSELGHLEGDLIIGANNASAVLTVIERVTRHSWLVDLPEGYHADAVLAAWTELLDQIPAHMRKSLTLDQGSEWAKWETLSATYDLPVWFCDPHSPWQRGAIENLNGHARFWLPRGTRLDVVSPAELARIAGLLNGQRRRSLGWDSPAMLYAAAC
jgi:transposase, IS30 family